MTIETVKQNLELLVANIQKSYRNWDGDLIDLTDYDKDSACYKFLLQMDSWLDDVLPPCISNRKYFLDVLYMDIESDACSNLLKNAIYLHLEPTLRDLVQEAYYSVNNVQQEAFAGYERGE
tara:strand:+ start:827 stop:1189 length:363 start_codon:yes stop_codon:yes gene_type:complete